MSEKTPNDILDMAQQRIATNKERERVQRVAAAQVRADYEGIWRLAFWLVLLFLLLALLFTPGATLEWKMYAVVHGLIAQQHTVFLEGRQLPLCARNIGIYSSFLITTMYLWHRQRQRAGHIPAWPITTLLIAFFLIMTVDGFNSMFNELGQPHLYMPRNELRTLTGSGAGIAIAVAVLFVFNVSLRQDVDRQQRIIAGWRDLGVVVALNFVVLIATYSNLAVLYWPVAWLAFLGLVGELYLINVLLSSLFLGYGRSVTRLSHLARPATVAFLPTTVLIASLALMRFWMEVQGMLITY